MNDPAPADPMLVDVGAAEPQVAAPPAASGPQAASAAVAAAVEPPVTGDVVMIAAEKEAAQPFRPFESQPGPYGPGLLPLGRPPLPSVAPRTRASTPALDPRSAPSHPPLVLSGGGPSGPAPPMLDKKWLEDLKKHGPEAIEGVFREIVDYVTMLNRYRPLDFPFPRSIGKYLRDLSLSGWFRSYMASHEHEFDLEAFILAVTHYITGEVRQPSSVALSDLIEGRVKQQSGEPVATYAERFFQRSRLLPSESQVSLCRHYIAGLLPDLRRLCSLDREGREHTDLVRLVQFSFSEETRLKVVSPSSFSSPVSRFSPSSSGDKRPQWRSTPPYGMMANKKPRTDAGPSSVVAAVESAVVAAVGTPSRPERERPVHECPLFKLVTGKGKKLSREQRDVLSKWGLCYFCKEDRHDARQCPVKAAMDRANASGSQA